MPQCEWAINGKECQNEATRMVYVEDPKCECKTCRSVNTFWICDRCAALAPDHWAKQGVIAHF